MFSGFLHRIDEGPSFANDCRRPAIGDDTDQDHGEAEPVVDQRVHEASHDAGEDGDERTDDASPER